MHYKVILLVKKIQEDNLKKCLKLYGDIGTSNELNE